MTTAFAALIESLIQPESGGSELASRIGVSEQTIRSWRSGEHVPYIATLLSIADQYQLPRDVVLGAAGKPSSTHLRDLLCTQPDATLAVWLDRYRTEHGLDTEAAAAVFSVNRWQFSRLANGSMAVASLHLAGRLARGLGVTPVDVLRAAGHDEGSPLLATAIEATSGFAGWLRDGIEHENEDSFERTVVSRIATSAGIDDQRLKEMLLGRRLPDLRDAQRVDRRFGFGLQHVLTRSGWDAGTARRVTDVVAACPSAEATSENLGEIMRTYRTRSGLSTIELARRVGMHGHSVVSRWESGQRTPGPRALIEFSDLTGAPLDRLFVAADLIA